MRAGPEADAAADLERLVRRLRGLSRGAWDARDRRATVRALLGRLAELTAPGHRVPDLPDHALGDAVAVLGHDALSDPDTAEGAAQLVRDALDQTR
jgi:hypothetical protein